MEVRLLPIKVGDRLLTRAGESCHLPAGLAAAVEVRVMIYNPDNNECVVQDAEGRGWKIDGRQNLKAGLEYQCEGRWLSPHDPRVIAEQQRHNAQHPE